MIFTILGYIAIAIVTCLVSMFSCILLTKKWGFDIETDKVTTTFDKNGRPVEVRETRYSPLMAAILQGVLVSGVGIWAAISNGITIIGSIGIGFIGGLFTAIVIPVISCYITGKDFDDKKLGFNVNLINGAITGIITAYALITMHIF